MLVQSVPRQAVGSHQNKGPAYDEGLDSSVESDRNHVSTLQRGQGTVLQVLSMSLETVYVFPPSPPQLALISSWSLLESRNPVAGLFRFSSE
jgi:hypothetical protein